MNFGPLKKKMTLTYDSKEIHQLMTHSRFESTGKVIKNPPPKTELCFATFKPCSFSKAPTQHKSPDTETFISHLIIRSPPKSNRAPRWVSHEELDHSTNQLFNRLCISPTMFLTFYRASAEQHATQMPCLSYGRVTSYTFFFGYMWGGVPLERTRPTNVAAILVYRRVSVAMYFC